MNGRNFILFLFMVLAVFVSGCNGGETRTEVISTDMLVIDSIVAVPSQVVRDGDIFVVRMDVVNEGQDDVWMLVDDDSQEGQENFDGDMVLVNFCEGIYELKEFKVVSKSLSSCDLPDPGYTVDITGKIIDPASACYLKFVPGQTHVFQWKITAPDKSRIRSLVHECRFNFQTIYAGVAETVTYVYFAIPHEVAQRIYTKNELTLTGDNVASYGPVVANFETGEAQPIRAGENDDNVRDTWTVYLNMKNLGSGVAKIKDVEFVDVGGSGISSIGPDSCELKNYKLVKSDISRDLVKYFTQNEVDCKLVHGDDSSKCGGTPGCYYIADAVDRKACADLLMLRNKLEIFEKESSRIGCTLIVPKYVNIMQPYRFVTRAHYAYFQGRDFDIKTEPKP